MSRCEICGSVEEVVLVDVKPIIPAARRKYNLCKSCRDKLDQGDAQITLALGGLIGKEFVRKASQPPTR